MKIGALKGFNLKYLYILLLTDGIDKSDDQQLIPHQPDNALLGTLGY